MNAPTNASPTSTFSPAAPAEAAVRPERHDFNKGPQYSADGKFFRQHIRADWEAVPVQPSPLAGPAVYAPRPPKTRFVYIILALFLGGLGIHNFYAGRYGSAIAQLLITLLIGWTIIPLFVVGLWALIEAIVVAHDGNGQVMV